MWQQQRRAGLRPPAHGGRRVCGVNKRGPSAWLSLDGPVGCAPSRRCTRALKSSRVPSSDKSPVAPPDTAHPFDSGKSQQGTRPHEASLALCNTPFRGPPRIPPALAQVGLACCLPRVGLARSCFLGGHSRSLTTDSRAAVDTPARTQAHTATATDTDTTALAHPTATHAIEPNAAVPSCRPAFGIQARTLGPCACGSASVACPGLR